MSVPDISSQLYGFIFFRNIIFATDEIYNFIEKKNTFYIYKYTYKYIISCNGTISEEKERAKAINIVITILRVLTVSVIIYLND
jgi:hypothetical protein